LIWPTTIENGKPVQWQTKVSLTFKLP